MELRVRAGDWGGRQVRIYRVAACRAATNGLNCALPSWPFYPSWPSWPSWQNPVARSLFPQCLAPGNLPSANEPISRNGAMTLAVSLHAPLCFRSF